MLSMMSANSAGGNHAANGALHLGEVSLGLFDARAGGRADVQADLSGVHLRKEIRRR